MRGSIRIANDRLGRLCLSDAGLLARDRFVVAQARARLIPLVAVIGGGYTHDVEALALRLALVFEALAAEAAAASSPGEARMHQVSGHRFGCGTAKGFGRVGGEDRKSRIDQIARAERPEQLRPRQMC